MNSNLPEASFASYANMPSVVALNVRRRFSRLLASASRVASCSVISRVTATTPPYPT